MVGVNVCSRLSTTVRNALEVPLFIMMGSSCLWYDLSGEMYETLWQLWGSKFVEAMNKVAADVCNCQSICFSVRVCQSRVYFIEFIFLHVPWSRQLEYGCLIKGLYPMLFVVKRIKSLCRCPHLRAYVCRCLRKSTNLKTPNPNPVSNPSL